MDCARPGGGARRELPHLRKKERSSLQHKQKKIRRDEAAQVKQAMSKSGAAFKRGWAGEDLATRAGHHGMGDEYAYYCLVSATLELLKREAREAAAPDELISIALFEASPEPDLEQPGLAKRFFSVH